MRNAVMDTTAEDNQATPVGDRTRSGSVAARCGERLLIADFYYAQPLSGLIGASLGMPGESNGLLVTPAADQLRLRLADDRAVGNFNENRWLVLCSSDLRHSACWRPPCSFKPYRFWRHISCRRGSGRRATPRSQCHKLGRPCMRIDIHSSLPTYEPRLPLNRRPQFLSFSRWREACDRAAVRGAADRHICCPSGPPMPLGTNNERMLFAHGHLCGLHL
jgi:hypothetical protein